MLFAFGSVFEPRTLLQSTRTKLLVALVSAAALVGGAFLRPRLTPTSIAPPQEHSAPLIEEEAQRRRPLRSFAALQDSGTLLTGYTISIPGPTSSSSGPVFDFSPPAPSVPQAAGFGVLVAPPGRALTHASALLGQSVLQIQTAEGVSATATVMAFEPPTGLALLQFDSPSPTPPPPIARDALRPGALAAMAARWRGSDIVAPVFVTEVQGDSYRFSTSGAPVPAGVPIFTLEGEVAAIASGPDRPGWAFSVQKAIVRLEASVAAGRGHPASFGITLQSTAGHLTQALGRAGVIVSDVLADGPAARAGVQPGDLLTTIAGSPVESIDAAHRAISTLTPGVPAAVEVVRAGQTQAVSVEPGAAVTLFGRGARGDAEAQNSPSASALFPTQNLRGAGVPPNARVLAVNGRPVSARTQALRELQRGKQGTVLYLQHEGQRFFAALPPSP